MLTCPGPPVRRLSPPSSQSFYRLDLDWDRACGNVTYAEPDAAARMNPRAEEVFVQFEARGRGCRGGGRVGGKGQARRSGGGGPIGACAASRAHALCPPALLPQDAFTAKYGSALERITPGAGEGPGCEETVVQWCAASRRGPSQPSHRVPPHLPRADAEPGAAKPAAAAAKPAAAAPAKKAPAAEPTAPAGQVALLEPEPLVKAASRAALP